MKKRKHDVFSYLSILEGKRVLRAVRKGDEDYLSHMGWGESRTSLIPNRGIVDAMVRAIATDDPFVVGLASMMLAGDALPLNAGLEFAHSEKGKTLFFESPQMIEGMARQSTRVDEMRLKKEWGVVGVAMPRGSKIFGHKARPLLFGRTEGGQACHWMVEAIKYVEKACMYGGGLIDESNLPDGFAQGQPILMWSTFDSDNEQWTIRSLPWDRFSTILPMTKKDWDLEELAGMEKTEAWERAHLRFIAGLVVFMDAFPERIVPGLPMEAGMELLTPQGKVSRKAGRLKPYTFKWPIVPDTGKPFSWVDDHLVYYKNERYVHVRGTYKVRKGHKRGLRFDPYTVLAPGGR